MTRTIVALGLVLAASARPTWAQDEGDVAGWPRRLETGDEQERLDAFAALQQRAGHDRLAGALPAIAKALEDERPTIAAAAAAVLSRMGDDAAAVVPALLRAANRDEVEVRAVAVAALVAMPSRLDEARPAIEAGLRDPSAVVRRATCEAIAASPRRVTGALEPLLGLLRADPDASVRAAAADALGTVGASAGRGAAALPALREARAGDGDPKVRERAANALWRLAPRGSQPPQPSGPTPEAIRELLVAMASRDPQRRVEAQQTLWRCGERDVPLLVEAFVRGDDVVGAILEGIQGEAGGRALEELVERGDVALCVRAGRALVPRGRPALVAVRRLLDDPDPQVRREGLLLLERVHCEGIVVPECGNGPGERHVAPTVEDRRSLALVVVAQLDPTQPELRRAAFGALIHLGREAAAAALPEVVRALDDAEQEVRMAAVRTLEAFGPGAAATQARLVVALGDADEAAREAAARALGALGEVDAAPLERLLAMLQDGREPVDVRVAVAEACAGLASRRERVAPALWSAAASGPPEVRAAAAMGLRVIGEPPARCAAALTGLLECDDADVRGWAVSALGHLELEPREVIPLLLRALGDADGEVRSIAASNLVRLQAHRDPDAVRALLAHLGDEDLVYDALQVVGAARAPAAVAPICSLLGTDDLRDAAAEALARIGEPALPALLAALDEDVPADDLAHLMRLLGELAPGSARVVERLAYELRHADPDIRRLAADLLAEVAPWSASGATHLAPFLGSGDPALRLAAATALARRGDADGRAADVLVALLDDERRASAAASMLGELGRCTPAIVSALLRPLARGARADRGAACGALLRLARGCSPPCDALLAARAELELSLRDRDDEVVRDAALTLAAMGPPARAALPALAALAHDVELATSTPARVAIAAIASGDAMLALPGLLADLEQPDDGARREAAAGALVALGPRAAPAIPALLRALREPDSREKRRLWQFTAAEALGQLALEPDAVVAALYETLREALAARYQDVNLLRSLATALARFGPAATRAAPALEEALGCEEAEVRVAARRALATVRGAR